MTDTATMASDASDADLARVVTQDPTVVVRSWREVEQMKDGLGKLYGVPMDVVRSEFTLFRDERQRVWLKPNAQGIADEAAMTAQRVGQYRVGLRAFSYFDALRKIYSALSPTEAVQRGLEQRRQHEVKRFAAAQAALPTTSPAAEKAAARRHATDTIAILAARGIRLDLDEDENVVARPAALVSEHDRKLIRDRKPVLVDALREGAVVA